MKLMLLVILTFFFYSASAQSVYWSAPIDIATNSSGNFYPRIVNNNQADVFVSWGDNDAIYFSKYNGSTFSQPILINNAATPAYTADWTGADLAASGDTIYIVFMHKIWKEKSYIATSFDGGQIFSAPTPIENYLDSASRFPTVDITASGQPIVSFMKMDTNGHYPNYVIRKSNDYGNTFGNEIGIAVPHSEACDCCPAAIKASNNNAVVFYRNNNNNLRNIRAAVAPLAGSSYTNFAIDNNNWIINACPATGPDGIIIGDTIYSVFRDEDKCYISRSSMAAGALKNIQQLGAAAGGSNQNYPRLDNDGNKVAIVWREQMGTNKLLVAHTDNILVTSFNYDTLNMPNMAATDVAVSANAIHIVYRDIVSGTVKYLQGTLWPLIRREVVHDETLAVYPNPSSDKLYIHTEKTFSSIRIYSMLGKNILNQHFTSKLDISSLSHGQYILELIDSAGMVTRKSFSKTNPLR